jgi:hypothetical protein
LPVTCAARGSVAARSLHAHEEATASACPCKDAICRAQSSAAKANLSVPIRRSTVNIAVTFFPPTALALSASPSAQPRSPSAAVKNAHSICARLAAPRAATRVTSRQAQAPRPAPSRSFFPWPPARAADERYASGGAGANHRRRPWSLRTPLRTLAPGLQIPQPPSPPRPLRTAAAIALPLSASFSPRPPWPCRPEG